MQSTTSSTRTFMPPKPEPKAPKTPRKKPQVKLNLPKFESTTQQLLIAALVIFSIFMFFQYREAKHKLEANSPAAASKKVDVVVDRVGKLIILPQDEKPSLATVLDPDKLKGQSFFKDVKKGDQVLVYSKEKRAILYRPSTNQLVNVASITVDTNQAAQ